MYFDGKGNFKFRSADDTVSKYVFANGFKKDGSDDNYFLTAGGGHVLRSSYLATSEANNKYFPRSLAITTVDLATLTLEGMYYGYQWVGAPTTTQTVIATVTVKRYSQDWIRQEFNRIDGTGITYVRDRYNGTTWGDWKIVASRDWVTANTIPYTGATSDLSLADKNLNLTSGSISKFENGMRVFNNVFQKFNSNTTQTGIISFKFPQATTSATMLDVTIYIYEYSGKVLGKLRVSFYKISATVINANGAKALWECTDNFPSTTVNVGIDISGNVCINLGEITTVWNTYTHFEIERVQASYLGANADWSKGWSQTIETTNPTVPPTPSNTYQSILNIVPEILATRTWLNGQIPNQPTLLGTSDLNTILIPGFYNQHANGNATPVRNYPASFGGALNVYKSIAGAIIQEYTLYHTGVTYKRVFNSVLWTSWAQVIDSVNGGTITGALNVNNNLTVVSNSTILGSTTSKLTVPASGSVVSEHNAVITNTNQNYGLAFGSITNGVQYIQATRFDGTTTNYELYLNPNGGTIRFGGNISSIGNELNLQRNAVTRFSTSGTSTLVSGEGGTIYLRPQGSGITSGQVIISTNGGIYTTSHGDSSIWNLAFNQNSIKGQNVSAAVTTLDTFLPNGGFITGYGSPAWGSSDAPVGASYGGYIKFSNQGDINNLDLYYNNGHNSTTAHRLWFRTKNGSNGTTNWFEVATREWVNTLLPTTTQINNWNNAFNFTSNFTTNYNDLVAIETLSGTNGYLRKDGNGQWSLVSSPVVDATATIAGKVKLGSDTIQTVTSNFVTATIGKTYSVQANSSGQLVVNVGWSDTNTTYTGGNGITLTGTNFTPTYGTSANTVAQGNDSRINNGQTAFGWGNHATAGYTSQSWVQSQNYATSNFVEERIDKLTGEIIDPTPSFSIKNEFTTVILTENFSKEPLELEGELIPERYISIINLTGSKVELTRDHNPIDIIYENETSEYYITKERRLVKKGTYKSAKTLI